MWSKEEASRLLGNVIGEGRTAEVLEYGEGRILKLYREEVPGHHVDWEYRISNFVYEQGVSTPKTYGQITAEGRQGIVYQQIHGPSLLKLIGAKPWLIASCGRQMAALHHSLHQLEGIGEDGEQKKRLAQNIIAAPMLDMDEKSKILSQLRLLPDGNKLCHGDFHPDNVLKDDRLWIIDWMTAVPGEPAADAARTLIMFSIGAVPKHASFFSKLFLGIARKRMTSQYLREYLRLSGLSMKDINPWVLPVAAARLVEWLPVSEKEQLVREIRRRLR
ncbi:aminoglycoside phosphotransferase family protein [Paenibacillus sp. MMS20-IR301]|uniref:phosphotransferase family protein n=1 Tax=Paenibacillus sp. MMS20-IR301 TaxID=2895946 RepID=UPI0028E88B8C|nr:aminoglycoside phosphotransferase family protein [Paenibacillus sp. MMS20-IR301]WNS47012.1 aminoglycoside phosphotransferase family protein [Paenibacillus sp. MMS20-IR301]